MSKKQLIPACGYLRKSTKGKKKKDGYKERQENSIPEQKRAIEAMAKGRFKIVKWYADEGVSGWKSGSDRPDFQNMLNDAKTSGIEAILVDNLDRFTRKKYREARKDADTLVDAGVKWIVTASHGEFHIGDQNDLGQIITFAAMVWAAHEYSRQLGRRVAIGMKAGALKGERMGGQAPYGYKLHKVHDDRPSTLVPDPAEAKIVKLIFHLFDDEKLSVCKIREELNRRKIPTPQNGEGWSVFTIRNLLASRTYVGELRHGRRPQGNFFYMGGKEHEIVETNGARPAADPLVRSQAFEPLIDQKLFDRVQRRLAARRKDRARCKRGSYVLSGVLRCSHCDQRLYGVQVNKKHGQPGSGHTVYRCPSIFKMPGPDCPCPAGHVSVNEKLILPFILELLKEEMANVQELLTAPPPELVHPRKAQAERKKSLESTRHKLDSDIRKMVRRCADVDDETWKVINDQIRETRVELAGIETELAEQEPQSGYSKAEIHALNEWWKEFERNAVSLPSRGEDYELYAQEGCSDEPAFPVSRRKVNEALVDLGARVDLEWNISKKPHKLVRGRFRLGQQHGDLPKYLLERSGFQASPREARRKPTAQCPAGSRAPSENKRSILLSFRRGR
jgi:site-specific DNA recombinase